MTGRLRFLVEVEVTLTETATEISAVVRSDKHGFVLGHYTNAFPPARRGMPVECLAADVGETVRHATDIASRKLGSEIRNG